MKARNLHFAGALVIALVTPAVAVGASYEDLTDDARKIVDKVKADSDANTVCESRETLRPAVQSAVQSLRDSGDLTGNPRADALKAGSYLRENCGSL